MDPKLRTALRRDYILKLSAFLLIVITSLVILLAVDYLLLSFVLAFVINYLLSPIVDILERRRVPRQAAILIPFLAGGIVIGIGVYKVLPLLTQQALLLESKLPNYQVSLMKLVSAAEGRFGGFLKYYNLSFGAKANEWILEKTAEFSSMIPTAISGSLTVLMLAPFFAFFMLQDGRQISRSLLSMVPNGLFEVALNLHHQINEQMGGFIRARFLEAAIVGFVVWVGLQICNFPYAYLLGLFAAVTNLIPYIGPIIGAVPAVLIAMISKEAAITDTASLNLIIVTSIYFFAQLVDIVFIIPLVVAKIVNLHPVTVIIVIIVGANVMGILGMVISIPVASAAKLIFRTFYDHLTEFRS